MSKQLLTIIRSEQGERKSLVGHLVIACILVDLLLLPTPVGSAGKPKPFEGLGKVHFATSCSPQVQAEFDAAVAMLHSFQYELAERTFSHVAQLDPGCAVAYWGKAMTLYHQLWDWPNAETLQRGRDYLEQAKHLQERSERETAYLHAAMAFFQPEQDLGSASRIQAYSSAMLSLHERYPEDADATAFYALSLLTLPGSGAASHAHQKEAITILQKLFASHPEHPGAAHYLIHAADTDEFAHLALPAALRYAQIAPSSPHALHMPSHIFVRLGMWQDSVASNLASITAAEEATRSQRDDGSGDELHAMMYLAYSYLQAGQAEDAREVTRRISAVPGATLADVVNNLSIFEALNAVETHDWERAATLSVRPNVFPYARVRTYWARAIGAARIGDMVSARQDLVKLDEARAGMLAYMQSVDTQMHMRHSGSSSMSEQQLEADAWVAWAEGKRWQALNMMRSAARREKFLGVESRSVPAYEMLGDMLLEMRRPRSALRAYAATLKESPGRLNALTGAARASRALGNLEEARFYYAALIRCCGALAWRAELAEAKLFLDGG